MPFKNNKKVLGRAPDEDVDPGNTVEQGVLIPWPSNPLASWLYYDCTVGVKLDSGVVVHNRLPQVNNLPDSLSSCLLDDPTLDSITGPGINLKSVDQYADIVQRMGHARYWFRLWGQALRVGYRVPIPGLKTIGGVPAIPYDLNPQWAFNRVFPGGNYGGIILWHAAWSLWYTTAVPPRGDDIPAVDAAAHISGAGKNVTDLNGIQAPFSQRDDDSATNSSIGFLGQ